MSRPFPPPTFPSIICGVLTVLAVAGALAVPVFAQTNMPPEITSATPFPVDEGTTAIATLTATDAENDALEWSIPAGTAGRADADTFNLTDTGGLTFTTAQDYEAPDDTDGDGTYEVTVQVSDTSATAPGETYVYQVKALRGAEASQGSIQPGFRNQTALLRRRGLQLDPRGRACNSGPDRGHLHHRGLLRALCAV